MKDERNNIQTEWYFHMNGRTKIKGYMKRINIARIAMEQTQRQMKILLNRQTDRRKNKYACIRKWISYKRSSNITATGQHASSSGEVHAQDTVWANDTAWKLTPREDTRVLLCTREDTCFHRDIIGRSCVVAKQAGTTTKKHAYIPQCIRKCCIN